METQRRRGTQKTLQAELEVKQSTKTTPFLARSFRSALLGAGGSRVTMGHLGTGEASQLRRVDPGLLEGSSLACSAQNGAFEQSAIDPAPSTWWGKPPSAGSQLASSREKTSDWTLIPAKIFFRRGCAALARFFCFLQSATAAGRRDHPAADKVSSDRPEPGMAWKSIG